MPIKLISSIILLLFSLSTIASKKTEEKITGVKVTKAQIAELYEVFNIVGDAKIIIAVIIMLMLLVLLKKFQLCKDK